jgi:hypothetical protein
VTTEAARRPAVLLGHVCALFVVLAALLVVVDPTVSYSADEGAVIAQVDDISNGSWTRPHPVPEIDDTGEWFPLEFPTVTDDGAASYVKHPLYPLVLVPFSAVAGTPGMVVLSVVGTVLAALGTALLTRRVAPGRELVALWLAGLGTPLLFDSFLVIAHTLAAAAVAGAMLATLAAVTGRRWVLPTGLAAVLIAVAVLLRGEALFIAPAIAVAIVLASSISSSPSSLGRRVAIGTILVVTAAATYLSESRVSNSILDESASEPFVITNEGAWLSARVNGFANTWLRPADGAVDLGSALLFAVPVVVAVIALLARRSSPDGERLRFLGVAAASAAVVGAVLAPDVVIPGLLVAFPFVVVPLVWAPELWKVHDERVLLVAFGAFALAVLGTQYEQGGTAEWGGRYFAVGIPLLVPLILAVWNRLREAVGPETARFLGVCAVVVLVCSSLVAINSLRVAHQRTEAVVSGVIDEVTARAEAEDPVVASIAALIPRLSWDHLDEARWLLVPEDDLTDLVERAEVAGLEELFVVTPGPLDAWTDDTGAYTVASSTEVWGTWTVTRLVPTG